MLFLLRLVADFFYIATSVLIALPVFVFSVWGGRFLHSGAALVAMALSVAWVVGGRRLLSKWRKSREAGMRKLISSIAPSFQPQVELADDLSIRYVGLDTTAGKVVVIDREKRVAKYEPITYIQRAEVSDAGDTVNSAFTFSFRDLSNPSIKILINKLRADDTSARIRYALERVA